MVRSLLLLAGLVSATPTWAGDPWEGTWVFSDCGPRSCAEITVVLRGDRAVVTRRRDGVDPEIWQEKAHLSPTQVRVESGIVGVPEQATLVTLRKGQTGTKLFFVALQSLWGNVDAPLKRKAP